MRPLRSRRVSRASSMSTPVRTARRMIASEKPPKTASLRRTSPSPTSCTSAVVFGPAGVALPRRRTRTVAAPMRASPSVRRRSSAPARRSASSERTSAARSPARRASGLRSSVARPTPSRKSFHKSAISRRGTVLKRPGSGGSPRGTSRSTARGIAAASTTAPSASRNEQRYCSAIQRASSKPSASNAGGPATRSRTSRSLAPSSHGYGAPRTYAKTSRVPSGTRTTSPMPNSSPAGMR